MELSCTGAIWTPPGATEPVLEGTWYDENKEEIADPVGVEIVELTLLACRAYEAENPTVD